MKKKNTKSCFTWLKNIFALHPINKASLCLTLSMVSLVSVGFSSWMLVGGATELGPIDVTVGEIIQIDDPLFKDFVITPFELSKKDGFVEDETIVSKGNIKATCSIDNRVARIGGFVSTDGNFKMTSTFNCNDINFSKNIPDPTINVTGAVVTPSSSGRVRVNQISLPLSSEDYTDISVTYTITNNITANYGNLPSMLWQSQEYTRVLETCQ